MVRPGDLRKMFKEMDEDVAKENKLRFPKMVKSFGNAKNLFEFQKLKAKYADEKVPNYLMAIRDSKPTLYKRLQNKVNALPYQIMADGKNILSSVKKNSSPKEFFDAMKKVNALNANYKAKRGKNRGSVFATKNYEAIGNVRFTQKFMAEELAKSRNLSNYGAKAMLFSTQRNYAKAVLDAKVMLANRVKKKYNALTNEQKKQMNISDINKTSSPEKLMRTIENFQKFKPVVRTNESWRFN